MANVKTKLAEQKKAGFNCPQCNFFIELSIESILYGPTQKCASCHTSFTMDRQESQVALGFLQELHVASKNLESLNPNT